MGTHRELPNKMLQEIKKIRTFLHISIKMRRPDLGEGS